MTEICFKIK